MMDEWRVAVISAWRADVLRRCTLAALERDGVDPERVTVFVPPDQLDDYGRALAAGPWAGRLAPGAAEGIAAQRWAAERAHPEGTPLLCLDDDVRGVRRVGPDGRKLEDGTLPAVARAGWAALAGRPGTRMWGLVAAANPFYMRRDEVAYGLLFCIGTVHGLFACHDEERARARLTTVKEDYERTLRAWEADGAVARLGGWTVATAMRTTPGGLQRRLHRADRRTVEALDATVLEATWPGRARRRTRKNGWPEVALWAPGTVRRRQEGA